MESQTPDKPLLAPFWIIAASIVGITDTLYLSWDHILGILPACAIGGCEIVLNSKYSVIFGVPLSYVGLVYYVYLLALAILLAIDAKSIALRLGVLGYAAIGL